ncbi:aspartic proteinase CDR1-like [Alnus glutinosa]|uniref:aspartic proteinase CDR1-like n=1 Tax=Alnus glutinosa TaxID=3517 RepID=UPI002D76E507|nr:aspartic proteinase CDR1-like [Alnus glutinosa]
MGGNHVTFPSQLVIVSILSNYLIWFLATASGFTVELIRRDSPKYPFYNANQTPKEQLNALSPKVHPSTAQSEVRRYEYQHLLKLSMGSPSIDIYGIVDTGSDLIWTQCVPCVGCYEQIYPLFDPSKSSTYSGISCESKQCHLLKRVTCSSENICKYAYGYVDGSLTQGVLAKETIAMTSTSGEKVSLDIVFGCGHNDTGTFNDHEMGIIGLGGWTLSFISQMASTFGGKKFSHCFSPFGTDPNITSKMSFGNGSEVFGDGVVSTPLISKNNVPWYFVTLRGISVGDKYLHYNLSGTVSVGNVLLDSGTPPMYLPQDFHDRLVAEVKQQIPLEPISEYLPRLCYISENNLDGPILTVHFEGADVLLMPIHTFPAKNGISCFEVYPRDSSVDGSIIYGNYAQSNFLIGYDMEKMTISFKPTDCTK